mmetsp:Transcript_117722/g.375219  ORF Transcript_117722/g.375219 Transcript_117722/m.375219 type:complete len:233 (+) Transcript_117722:639-1337(+)
MSDWSCLHCSFWCFSVNPGTSTSSASAAGGLAGIRTRWRSREMFPASHGLQWGRASWARIMAFHQQSPEAPLPCERNGPGAALRWRPNSSTALPTRASSEFLRRGLPHRHPALAARKALPARQTKNPRLSRGRFHWRCLVGRCCACCTRPPRRRQIHPVRCRARARGIWARAPRALSIGTTSSAGRSMHTSFAHAPTRRDRTRAGSAWSSQTNPKPFLQCGTRSMLSCQTRS